MSTELPSPAEQSPAAALFADAEKGPIQSIERAASVLNLLNHETRSLTPAIVAESLGLNRSTSHRYLQSLQKSGFLDAGYAPGPLIDQLSMFRSPRQRILDLGPSVLRQLADRTGLTAVLSFLGRSGAVVTRVEEATTGTVVLTIPVGTALELRAAQSRVLLAFQSDPAVVQRMHAGLSSDEARAEMAALSRVRRDRIAWADLGHAGVASVAAPVFGPHDIQAAMGILGTTAMLSPGDSTERVEALKEAAEKLGALIAN